LSDIPSHREIVQDHRFAGRIFSIGKREMLSQEINNLLRGLLHEQKKEARQIVDERYSAGLMAKRYQDLYLKLTNG
jgi:glycosyltransferase involved in cell wall biosynthesis